jgi:hypothetical protein
MAENLNVHGVVDADCDGVPPARVQDFHPAYPAAGEFVMQELVQMTYRSKIQIELPGIAGDGPVKTHTFHT